MAKKKINLKEAEAIAKALINLCEEGGISVAISAVSESEEEGFCMLNSDTAHGFAHGAGIIEKVLADAIKDGIGSLDGLRKLLTTLPDEIIANIEADLLEGGRE